MCAAVNEKQACAPLTPDNWFPSTSCSERGEGGEADTFSIRTRYELYIAQSSKASSLKFSI